MIHSRNSAFTAVTPSSSSSSSPSTSSRPTPPSSLPTGTLSPVSSGQIYRRLASGHYLSATTTTTPRSNSPCVICLESSNDDDDSIEELLFPKTNKQTQTRSLASKLNRSITSPQKILIQEEKEEEESYWTDLLIRTLTGTDQEYRLEQILGAGFVNKYKKPTKSTASISSTTKNQTDSLIKSSKNNRKRISSPIAAAGSSQELENYFVRKRPRLWVKPKSNNIEQQEDILQDISRGQTSSVIPPIPTSAIPGGATSKLPRLWTATSPRPINLDFEDAALREEEQEVADNFDANNNNNLAESDNSTTDEEQQEDRIFRQQLWRNRRRLRLQYGQEEYEREFEVDGEETENEEDETNQEEIGDEEEDEEITYVDGTRFVGTLRPSIHRH